MKEIYKNLSKTMAHALRHDPKQYGLILDENGWLAIDILIAGLKSRSKKWNILDRNLIEAMIADADKKRYEIAGDRIRAVYGHSSPDIEISYEASEPPEILYHGTTPQVIDLIKVEGLRKMNRKYVHLSPDTETAIIVARRRTSQPVLIKIEARKAYKNGLQFYYGHDQVWLSENISAEYLNFEDC
ncbi:MAG: RNA 2'-phosphotransferase [Methyloligellaceae bacterium]